MKYDIDNFEGFPNKIQRTINLFLSIVDNMHCSERFIFFLTSYLLVSMHCYASGWLLKQKSPIFIGNKKTFHSFTILSYT